MLILKLKNNSAFTLVEVLLAMLITSVISLGLVAMSSNARDLYERVDAEIKYTEDIAQVAQTMRNEIGFMYIPRDMDPNDACFELKTVSDSEILISFYCLSPSHDRSPASSPPAKIEYYTEFDDNDNLKFCRRKQPASGHSTIGAPQEQILIELLETISCEVYLEDKKTGQMKWQSDFDSKNELPFAIKFNLKLRDRTKEVFVFPIIANKSSSG